ncbi:ABC transporter ATP-binding protein [Sporosarcina thermotolerans]|nr:ABC transporter ATP-binding protein [Sporosarcina thermotolerans]WHT48239.1 ABC transporter ATP-binding protein [Sporosarcina thermotolerans]
MDDGRVYGNPKTASLLIILGIYVLLMVGQGVFKRSQTILGAKIQQGFIRKLKEDTYKGLLHANWGFYLKKRKSDIINIMTNEMYNVSAGIYLFLQFMSSIILTFIQIAIAFYLSVKMTSFILFFGLILILFSKKFIRKSHSLGKETFGLTETYMADVTDHLNGMKDIKSNSLEENHLRKFFSLTEKMEKNRIKLVTVNSTSQMLFKMVSAILIAAFIFFSIEMVQAQTAQVMLVVIIFAKLWPRITGIQSNLEQLGSTMPSLKALLDLQNECADSRELQSLEVNDVKPIVMKFGLNCLNVHFKYDSQKDTYALRKVDVHIPFNRMTAIVGASGAGKSTLIDLLMGLNKADRGMVTIDNEPLTNENVTSLRRSISYIPQDPFLFNATVRENLLIIDPDATEDRIWEALEFAAAAEFIRKLPQGLDTRIGDRGIRLSGGERQRLVLARAILRQPSILILDEATSALDVENEAKIQEAIERLKGKMTIIVIAHRLSTIRNADQIVVMDAGEIIQTGDYNRLAKEKEGVFGNLLDIQMQTIA